MNLEAEMPRRVAGRIATCQCPSMQSEPMLERWPPSAAYRRAVAIILAIVYALNQLDRQIVNILLEPIKREFTLTDTQAGLMSGLAFALFYCTLGIPLAWFPRLLHGTPEQRAQVELSRMGLHWDDLDEDISIAGLLQGRGDQTSARKAAA